MLPTPTPFSSSVFTIENTLEITFSCSQASVEYRQLLHAVNTDNMFNVICWIMLGINVFVWLMLQTGKNVSVEDGDEDEDE